MHLEQIAENILFFFYRLKGVRNLHLGGYSIVNLYDFSGVRFLIDQLKIYCIIYGIIYGRKIYNKFNRKLERIVHDVSKAE